MFPVYIKEDSASATTGTATSSSTSLTLTTSNTSANVTITPNSANGTFAMSSTNNEAKFSVSTNNYTGYELRIKADDDNGNLVNIDNGNTHTISSIPSSITKSSFDTTTYNNKWGYKPNKYLGPNSTIVDNTGDSALFLPSPTTSGTVLDHTTTPNTTANNYTIALGIRADHNTYAGTYSKTFALVATANPTTYTINYNKNTTDSVSNMPATQSDTTSATGITLADNTPERDSYLFLGWCNVQPTTTDYVDSCSGGTTYQPGGAYGIDQTTANTTTLYAMWKINSFTQTTQVRYEDVNGNWGDYSTVETKQVAYGSNYSWSTSQISGFNSAMYQSASVASYTVTGAKTNQVSIYRNTFTCTKQYRLETESGGWDSYTSDGTINNVRYGGSCSYSKTVTDYRGASNAANGAQGSTSASNITANTTLSLDFYRNTYTLTVSAGTNTTVPSNSGAGTYRWGQPNISVYINKSANATCTSYAVPTWTQSGTAGTVGTTTQYSGNTYKMNFAMGKGNVTLTAASAASNVAQTITLSKGTGVSSIKIGSTNYSGTSVSLNCGTYNISGNYSSGYEFSSWSRSGSITVANTASASTTMTVNGKGTLTLTGKLIPVTFAQAFSAAGKTQSGGYYLMQDMTTSICSTATEGQSITLKDNRDSELYLVEKMKDGRCWMLDNLRLGGTSSMSLTSSNTNVASSYTLPASISSGFGGYGPAHIYTGLKNTVVTNFYGKGSNKAGTYYNYCAISAGVSCSTTYSSDIVYDICPKGWRLPTGGSNGEFNALYKAYDSNTSTFRSAFSISLAGMFNNSATDGQESEAFYASSTAYQGQAAYNLRYTSSKVRPTGYTQKNYGISVRCTAK